VTDTLTDSVAAQLVAELTRRHLTVAVAESLTGGLLLAEFVAVPGASAVLLGGIVAYKTAVKHTLLGVDATLLAEFGPVHPDVAAQMALGVRDRLAVSGVPADIGLATTGVAGPDEQDGHPVGEAYIGIAFGTDVHTLRLALSGSRGDIRAGVVAESLASLRTLLRVSDG
jgi:nicotinamide-nucleotide amidase